jgi:hypothetical protein
MKLISLIVDLRAIFDHLSEEEATQILEKCKWNLDVAVQQISEKSSEKKPKSNSQCIGKNIVFFNTVLFYFIIFIIFILCIFIFICIPRILDLTSENDESYYNATSTTTTTSSSITTKFLKSDSKPEIQNTKLLTPSSKITLKSSLAEKLIQLFPSLKTMNEANDLLLVIVLLFVVMFVVEKTLPKESKC